MTAAITTQRRSRSAYQWKLAGLRALPVVVIVVAWVLGNTAFGVSPLILPDIVDSIAEIGVLLVSPDFYAAVGITIMEIIGALLLASAIGLIVGFLLGRVRFVARVFESMLGWVYMFPFVLLYPIFLLGLGVGPGSKVVYAGLVGAIPIAYNTVRGLAHVDKNYLRVARAFGARPLATDLHVRLSAALPMIRAGMRIGFSLVLISVILAELLGSTSGLGFELQRASDTFQNARAFALVILILVVCGVLQYFLERLLTPNYEKYLR
ncbi:ABC transporter permease [Microbacterium sp. NPDC058342]|uniref:ABC transporter permease n=1 Tax=Microbacterium sp. NPDC058342 TaxID=3346454 RepID=UPI003657E347